MIKNNTSFLFVIYFFITTLVYVIPFINLPLGFDTAWIFLIQSNNESLTVPFYYESMGIVPGNIIESVKSFANFYGRASFLNLAQYWILAKYFSNIEIIWRLLPIVAMTFSVTLWHKILLKFHLSKLFVFIIILFLLTDPLSVWIDWNKAESIGFLFYTLSCYFALNNIDKNYYFGMFCFLISLFFKETFLLGLPLIFLIRLYFSENTTNTLKDYFVKFFIDNRLFILLSVLYAFFLSLFFLTINSNESYLFSLNYEDSDFVGFLLNYIDILTPIYFDELSILYFISFLVLLTYLFLDITFFSTKDGNEYSFKCILFVFYLLSLVTHFIIHFELGMLHRRYSIPMNIFSYIFVVFCFKLYFQSFPDKYKKIIYFILILPALVWILKFSYVLFFLTVILIFVALYVIKLINNKILLPSLVMLIIFMPVTDQVLVNITASKSELIAWKKLNHRINHELESDITIVASLSENFNSENIKALEVQSFLNNRKDIIYIISKENLGINYKPNSLEIREIDRFNEGKSPNIYDYYNIYKEDRKNYFTNSLFHNIKNRYNTDTYHPKYFIESN